MLAPVYPALQVQLPLLRPEDVFAGQLEQFDADGNEYLPALHARHDTALRMSEYFPAAQFVQTVADEIFEALPIVQAEQNDDPFMLENLPAPHGWQSRALLKLV